ncbi:MAG TPA: hypothetical protein PLI05_07910 [Methanotrichaceae archaeon]|nr:hypothetical protein [Methanotrichaceae archaeon]HQI91595.1 hypothetical protein [Methanotrichaceae archaeon]
MATNPGSAEPAHRCGIACQWDGVPDDASMILILDQVASEGRIGNWPDTGLSSTRPFEDDGSDPSDHVGQTISVSAPAGIGSNGAVEGF